MPTRFSDDYWRGRAEDARTRAGQLRDPAARKTLLGIADNYEQLAEQAERLRLTGSPQSARGVLSFCRSQ